jgi:hypothetical protein
LIENGFNGFIDFLCVGRVAFEKVAMHHFGRENPAPDRQIRKRIIIEENPVHTWLDADHSG